MVNQINRYILIIPGFGIISTTISANSNKSVFGYIGMVRSRPALTNTYADNPFKMLGSSNTLNTNPSRVSGFMGKPNWASNNRYYCNNVKDITMNYKQETLFSMFTFNVLKIIYWLLYYALRYLRDYTEGGIWVNGCLRYSPLFCEREDKLPLNICKLFKRKFSTSRPSLRDSAPTNVVLERGIKNKLDPNWVTGFVDAEGCFSVIIEIPEPSRLRRFQSPQVAPGSKWKVRISFEINLHEKDKDILYEIQSFFGVGAVYHRADRKKSVYRVTNVTYIKNVIIPHFINYPLISKKCLDFLLWSKVVVIILNKDHLTKEGFTKILSYYASINRGVSKKVIGFYPDILPIDKPIIALPENLNPQWVSGFTAGDGGFSIYVRPAKDYVLGEKVYCRYHIAQHSKDLELMQLFIKFFGTGKVVVRSNTSTPSPPGDPSGTGSRQGRCDFIIQDTSFLLDKIISHFDLYPLLNLKQKDFICFKESLLLIKEKKHLTREGLDKIKSLNLEMNSNRLR